MPLTRIDSAFLDLDAIGGIDFDVQSGVPTFTVDATNHRVGIGTDAPNYTAQVNRIGGNTDVMQVKGNTGNSFIRFTDSNASSDYSLGADDAISNGFILYDRNASGYRVVVNSAGNVGIGLINPAVKLQVDGTGVEVRASDNANSKNISLYGGTSTNDPAITFTDALRFYSNSAPAERVRIDSSGRLLVGTTTARTNYNNHNQSAEIQLEGINTAPSTISVIQNAGGHPHKLGGRLILGRSDGSDIGSNTIVPDDRTIGTISFQGNDGSEFCQAAMITAQTDSTTLYDRMPGRLVFYTTASTGGAPPERMRIDSAGNVGIGNNDPQSKLQIENAGEQLRLTYPSIASYIHEVKSNGDYAIDKDGTERLRITSTGSVGIGTDSPRGILHVSSGTSGDATLILEADTDNSDEADNPNIVFRQDSGLDLGSIGMNFSNSSSIVPSNELYIAASSGGGSIIFATGNSNGYTNAAERLRITSGGYVGINLDANASGNATLTPWTNLHVVGANVADGVAARNNATPTGQLHVSSTGWGHNQGGTISLGSEPDNVNPNAAFGSISARREGTLSYQYEGYLAFNTSSGSNLNERLRIGSNGRLSIKGSTANMEYLRMGGNNDRGLRFTSSSGTSSVGVVHTINAPGDSGAQGEIVFQTNSGERLRVDANGNVGIGTNDPVSKLHISGDSGTLLRLDGGASGTGTRDIIITEFNQPSYGGIIRYHSVEDRFTFGTLDNSVVKEAINVKRNNGNVGIGTTDPATLLDVRGGNESAVTVGTTSQIYGRLYGSPTLTFVGAYNGADLSFSTSSSTSYSSKMIIKNGGNVGIGTDNPIKKVDIYNGSTDSDTLRVYNDEVGINMGTWGTGSSYPRTVTVNGTRFDAGTAPKLRIGGQGGIEFAADLNNVKAVINTSGNVGIGTDNPAVKLQVDGSNIEIRASNDSNSKNISLYGGSSSNDPAITFTDALRFYSNSAGKERFRINNYGNSIFQSQAHPATNGITGNAGLLIRGKTVDGSSTTVDLNISQSASTNGIHLEIQENSNNANALASLVFNHGSLKAMIATSRAATNNWGTDLRFYTHDDSTTSANQHKVYERLRITSSGAVCMGKTSPNRSTNGLAFYPGSNNDDGTLILANARTSGGSPLEINRINSNGNAISFYRAGTAEGTISVSTSGVTYATTSDIRLKTDIRPISAATDKLMAMNPVTYKWKKHPDGDLVHGFIAQEMRNIVPESVCGEPNGDEMMSMDYGRITPIIVSALQNAIKEINTLKQRILELEN